jgi:CcmD family protein
MKSHAVLARLAAAFCLLLGLAAPVLALAQSPDGYEPVNEATRVRTDANPFILGAYGFIWVAVVVYVVMLARNMRRTQAELEQLRRKVGGG